MAHWDHLGKHDSEQTPDGKADVIYNGAVDNGTGVAGILEIAASSPARRRRRSVRWCSSRSRWRNRACWVPSTTSRTRSFRWTRPSR